ncbi:uncharacterized protein NPIL_471631 [Nephila pilipes]|uniref:Uncharacterized protein n=1 Tax=Nephila pilipes TaxID=299642 RepID=A0A8X6NV51_NEPPI|nr:uncharacterized protein NPIL_471631 [Nephila pilipes]
MFRRVPSRRAFLKGILVADLLLLPILFLLFSKRNTPPPFIAEHPYFLYDLDASEPRSSGQKCVLPRLHPLHPSIWNYLSPPKDIVCKTRRPDLTYISNEGNLLFNSTEVQRNGYTVGKNLHCFWSTVLRAGDNQDDDDKVVLGEEFPLPENGSSLPFDHEVFQARCKNFAGLPVYDKLHFRIRNIPQSEKKILKNPVNVLIFGLDSMSRLGFMRLLPHTYQYLTDTLQMTVFRGMNKIGDNTYPNLVALLTGKKAYGGGLPDESEGFDDWPLIWKNYSSAGYNTMWAEDFPQYGLFNYLAKGFRRPPTDHYLRPFWLALEESTLLKFSSHMCYGSLPKHLLQMDYVRQFISKYHNTNRPYFGFSFLADLSHEYLSRVASADDQFEEFFKHLHEFGYLDNTVLIVMSDHGHRFDAIRTTQVGHVEERMPFFAIHIPKTISSKQTEILRTLSLNSGRLVTPFDTYATLTDLLGFATNSLPLGTTTSPSGTLGQSLFKEVPLIRTCENASIPEHYCICENETPILDSDTRAVLAATATIRHINDLLKDGGSSVVEGCATLTLKVIRTAHLVKTAEETEEDSEFKVRVVIEAEPSGGIFEATTLVRGTEAKVLVDVSRINPYGDQSNCIKHVILRKYCYCIEQIKNGNIDINKLRTS